uniref:DUF834 domain-containing protein n=1 Tax=Oryza barthii TaxID=65489 RepID=A0A0D3H7K1_9ORYZ
MTFQIDQNTLIHSLLISLNLIHSLISLRWRAGEWSGGGGGAGSGSGAGGASGKEDLWRRLLTAAAVGGSVAATTRRSCGAEGGALAAAARATRRGERSAGRRLLTAAGRGGGHGEQELGGASRGGWRSSPPGATQRRSSAPRELAVARRRGRGMTSDAVRRRPWREDLDGSTQSTRPLLAAQERGGVLLLPLGGGVERGRRWSRDAVDPTIGVVDGGGEPLVVVVGDERTSDSTMGYFCLC